MKIRLTIITENDKPRRPEHTEELVTKAWQSTFDFLIAAAGSNERARVEKVEFINDREGDDAHE